MARLLLLLLPLLGNLIGGCEGQRVRVYEFQASRVQSDSSIRYVWPAPPDSTQPPGPPQPPPTSLSFCIRLRFYFLWEVSGFLQLTDTTAEGGPVNVLRAEVNLNYLRVTLGGFRRFHFLKVRPRALTWHQVCLTFHHDVTVSYLDGVEQDRRISNLTGPIVFDQVKVGAWDAANSFSGQITKLDIWSKVLSATEIANLWECSSNNEGDVVSWSGTWEATGDVGTSDVLLGRVCKAPLSTDYFFFNEVTAPSAFSMCEGLGGAVPVPRSEAEYQELQDVVDKYQEKLPCQNFWVGITDRQEEGVWTEPYNNQQLDPMWSVAEPDGDNLENCAVASSPTGLSDNRCDMPLCVVCAVHHRPIWRLLGTCERHQRNTHFVASQDDSASLLFRGYSDYEVVLGQNKSEWLWWDWKKNQTVASIVTPINNLPIGRQKWTLKRPMCDQAEGDVKKLLLTPCGEGNFSCDDASCIPLFQRCDLKFDCRDQSDESGCQLVRFPPVYRPDLPPAINYKLDTDVSEPLPVTLHIVIESADVDTRSMHMHVNLNVSVTWRESRIDFLNLNQDYTLNRVPYETMQKLWVPVVDFTNTKGNHITLTDSEATMVVNMQGTPSLGDDTTPEELEVYRGPENPLSVRRKYSITFQCQFDLKMYPFDQQYCHLELTMLSASSRLLVFDEASTMALFQGNPQLVEYTVGEVDIDFMNDKDFAVMFVKVQLLRRAGFIIMNVYIPSLCLLVISYLTLYFTAAIFQVRVLASLTSLLVMATLFTQASSSLPKTSYFKMVDVWLLSSIFFIFIIIVLHTIIDRVREWDVKQESHAKAQEKMKRSVATSPTERPANMHPSGIGLVATGGSSPPQESSGLSEVSETSRSAAGVVVCVSQPILQTQPSNHVRGMHEQIIHVARITLFIILVVFNIFYWTVVLI